MSHLDLTYTDLEMRVDEHLVDALCPVDGMRRHATTQTLSDGPVRSLALLQQTSVLLQTYMNLQSIDVYRMYVL